MKKRKELLNALWEKSKIMSHGYVYLSKDGQIWTSGSQVYGESIIAGITCPNNGTEYDKEEWLAYQQM